MRISSVFEFFWKLETGDSMIFENIKESELEQYSESLNL